MCKKTQAHTCKTLPSTGASSTPATPQMLCLMPLYHASAFRPGHARSGPASRSGAASDRGRVRQRRPSLERRHEEPARAFGDGDLRRRRAPSERALFWACAAQAVLQLRCASSPANCVGPFRGHINSNAVIGAWHGIPSQKKYDSSPFQFWPEPLLAQVLSSFVPTILSFGHLFSVSVSGVLCFLPEILRCCPPGVVICSSSPRPGSSLVPGSMHINTSTCRLLAASVDVHSAVRGIYIAQLLIIGKSHVEK